MRFSCALLTEHSLVIDVFDNKPRPGRKRADQDVEIKKERHPRGRLMLRYGGYDRDVDLSIAGVPQGVETPTPRSNITQICEGHYGQEYESSTKEHSKCKHRLKL